MTFSLQPRASFSKLREISDIFSGIPLGSGCEKHEEQSSIFDIRNLARFFASRSLQIFETAVESVKMLGC